MFKRPDYLNSCEIGSYEVYTSLNDPNMVFSVSFYVLCDRPQNSLDSHPALLLGSKASDAGIFRSTTLLLRVFIEPLSHFINMGRQEWSIDSGIVLDMDLGVMVNTQKGLILESRPKL